MPRTPIMGPTTKAAQGPNLPQQSVQNAGIVHQAMSQLGGQVAQLGMDLYKKQKKEELLNWGLNNKTNYDRDIANYENELKMVYNGSDFKGYAQEFAKGVSKIREKYLASADSDAKKNYFKQITATMTGRYLTKADLDEPSYTSQYYQMETSRNISKIAGIDYDRANREIKEYSEHVKYSEYFDNRSKMKSEESLDKQAFNTYKSLIDNGMVNLAEDLLAGKDPKNTDAINSRITKQQKAYLQGKITQQKQMIVSKVRSEAKKDINMAMKALMTGETPITDPLIQKTLQKASILPEKDFQEVKAQTTKVVAMSQLKDFMADVPPRLRDVDKNVDMVMNTAQVKGLSGAVASGELKKDLKAYSEVLNKQFEKDPVKYYIQHDNNLKNLSEQVIDGDALAYGEYKAVIDSKFDMWGTEQVNRRYVSPEMQKGFGDLINTADKERPAKAEIAINQVITKIENMAGDDTPMLMSQLNIPERYAVLGEIRDPINRQRAVNNVMHFDQKAYEDYTKKIPTDQKADREDLQNNDYYQAYTSIGGGQFAAENARIILDLVHREYKMMEMNNVEDAKDKVWDIFKNSYTPVVTNNISVLAPSDLDTDVVKDYLTYKSQEYNDFIPASNHKWVTAPNRQGVMLTAHQTGESKYKPIPGKDSKYVFIPFTDMINPVIPKQDNWMDIKRKEIEKSFRGKYGQLF